MGMVAIGGEEDIVTAEDGQEARSDGFLPAIHVQVATDLAMAKRAFGRLFEPPGQYHLRVRLGGGGELFAGEVLNALHGAGGKFRCKYTTIPLDVSRPIPSRDEVIALMTAKVAEARASLRSAAGVMERSPEQRDAYDRVMAALDELDRRIQRLRESSPGV